MSQPLYSAHPHWWFFWRQLVHVLVALVVVLICLSISPGGLWPVMLFALAVAGISVWLRYVIWSFTELRITETTFELHVRTLLGTKEPVVKSFAKITDVAIRQNLAEQLLGIGDVTVIDSGGNAVTAMDVTGARRVEAIIRAGISGQFRTD